MWPRLDSPWPSAYRGCIGRCYEKGATLITPPGGAEVAASGYRPQCLAFGFVDHRQQQPSKRNGDQQVRQILAVDAVGAVRLGGPVKRLAVREHIRFCELVETVDQKLRDKEQEEDGGDLKEQPEVDAMAVSDRKSVV